MRWIYNLGFIGLFLLTLGTSALAAPDIDVWRPSGSRLARRLRGKTREEVLYQITSVSTQDKQIQAADGTLYALVQYGRGEDARRILFQAEEPQTFIACAVTPAQTRALMENYQLHLDLSEKEFTALFDSPTPFYSSGEQTVYQLTPNQKDPFFLLFEQGRPVRTLTKNQAEEFIKYQQKKDVPPSPKPVTPQKRTPRKALVSGGTLYDQMYMPRVVFPQRPDASRSDQSAPSKL